jgi:ABC-type Fe3+-hydroxamate transport system substrate-binding protein
MLRLILAAVFAAVASLSYAQDSSPIVTESTSESRVTTDTRNETTVNSPPPSAISPSINASNSDLCTVGMSGAVQTQILGISGGSTIRDMNCERLKLSKTLYDMGMKVAAVSVMCQDSRVFDAMQMAGTPCPFEGRIGPDARIAWEENPEMKPEQIVEDLHDNTGAKNALIGVGVIVVLGALVGL